MSTEPTLRTFTLNYFKAQGGEAVPLDTKRRRWEIRLPDRRLDLTFDPNASAEAMVPGSTQWREILADCASRGAVSYRHVVTAPIADPAAVLAGAIPAEWRAENVRLIRVITRRAVCFTHRVSYGAAAFGQQPEELHHDALDVQTGERVAKLSESLPKLATIPVSAPPEFSAIDDLHARALALVDRRSTDRGKGMEMTLEYRRADAENRIREHYKALRAEVQAREVADLSSRLARVLEQIQSSAPQDLARFKEEGASLAKRLDQARKGRSVAVTSLSKVEADALEAERERHEVVITTELVGLCVVSYDRVDYEAELVPRFPDGEGEPRRVRVEISFTPVTGELVAPACSACADPAKDPIITDSLRYACRACAKPCIGCGRTALSDEVEPTACHSCGRPVCGTCGVPCSRCGQVACGNHTAACHGCAEELCGECALHCATCDSPVCPSCAREIHHRQYCADHVADCERCRAEVPGDLAQRCHLTGVSYCLACALACVECGLVTRRDLLKFAPSGRGLVCPDHLVACGTCQAGILPREAAHCPGCGKHHCPEEAPFCQECGLPTCRACTPDDQDRCQVCAALTPADEDDPRLETVLAAMPDLEARTLLLAEMRGYLVAEWHGKLGAWGRVALSPTGEVLAECRYGPVAALWQEVVSLVRR
ncbi:MAG: hypothetical protein FJZ01_22115 [Candidatus Sericytochromatia bacterium]|nr:hypothetical protein [Candidatus Tanganyikabacteria bacterium]